jgi:hypothetical protein
MYKPFAFEGEVHQSLSCVPLTVRRKLDVAGLKISLDGWTTLTREERLALCHLPVDSEAEVTVYQEVMRGFCARHAVPLKPLTEVRDHGRSWNADDIPPPVVARLREVGRDLPVAAWRALDEESRYALLKLADPKQAAAKFQAALAELGFAPPSTADDQKAAEACDRMDQASDHSDQG